MLQSVFGKSQSAPSIVPKALNPVPIVTPYSLSLQQTRFQNRVSLFTSRFPRAKYIFAGLGVISLALSFDKEAQARKAVADLAQRKEKLSKPAVVLTGSDSQNPPINEKNIEDWLYKTVTINGRPIHARAMMIPTISYGLSGFEYLVPFVTKENEDGSVQHGLILNLGFIPREFAPIWARSKIENVEEQTFTCVVTDGHHLSQQGGLLRSNNVQENQWEYADLQQLAQHTGFANQEQTRSCILEHVNPHTPNDERDCRHIDISSNYKEDYPYRFTRSGILHQPGNMPWDLNRQSAGYGLAGLGLTISSALLFFLR